MLDVPSKRIQMPPRLMKKTFTPLWLGMKEWRSKKGVVSFPSSRSMSACLCVACTCDAVSAKRRSMAIHYSIMTDPQVDLHGWQPGILIELIATSEPLKTCQLTNFMPLTNVEWRILALCNCQRFGRARSLPGFISYTWTSNVKIFQAGFFSFIIYTFSKELAAVLFQWHAIFGYFYDSRGDHLLVFAIERRVRFLFQP